MRGLVCICIPSTVYNWFCVVRTVGLVVKWWPVEVAENILVTRWCPIRLSVGIFRKNPLWEIPIYSVIDKSRNKVPCNL